ncbi:hypothetical protein HYV81_01270 [Candidatus Woesearchaeota archaeon]|nr:hypothetical protein [Candidatus Woesearchaeota archaeon]
MTGKRGQVTLFIIVGIALVILTGIYTYYIQTQVEEAELVPPKAEPIKNFVESCISNSAEQGLQLLALQGGYLEIPAEVERDTASYLSLGDGAVKLPYWYYRGNSRIPSLSLMENQLSRYISSNADSCMQNFQAFDKEFEITAEASPKITVTIGEKDVIAAAEYPLNIKSKADDEEIKLTKFRAVLPVRLKQMYGVASQLMQEENRNSFLEQSTIDLMALHPDIPFTGMEFKCGQMRWRLSEIQANLQEMLYFNAQKMRIENTDYAPFLADKAAYQALKKYTMEDFVEGRVTQLSAPDDAYDYFHFLYDIGIKKTDLGAGFQYFPEWGMQIEARPSESNILKSNVGKSGYKLLNFVCINIYHFTYDVRYPILVSIRDDTAFKGRGYTFRFSFPVLINHNKPDRQDTATAVFEAPSADTDLACSLRGDEVYDIRALGTDEHGISNIELQGVNISYDCFQFSCQLGVTRADEGLYRLRTQLPQSCSNGFIVAEKEGYMQGRAQVLDSTDVDVKLSKLRTLKMNVLRHKLISGKIEAAEPLAKNMVALVSLKNLDEPAADTLYGQFPDKDAVIALIDSHANYEVTVHLYDTVDNILIGGYQGTWNVADADISGKSGLVFHAVEYIPKPLNEEDQFKLITYLQDNAAYKDALKPRFE